MTVKLLSAPRKQRTRRNLTRTVIVAW